MTDSDWPIVSASFTAKLSRVIVRFSIQGPEFEEHDQQCEHNCEGRSGRHQPDHVKRVNRFEAGVAGYANKGLQSQERHQWGQGNGNSRPAPRALFWFGVGNIYILARIHGNLVKTNLEQSWWRSALMARPVDGRAKSGAGRKILGSARRWPEQPPADDVPKDDADAEERDECDWTQPDRELDQGFNHEQGDGAAHHSSRRAGESDPPVVRIHFHKITFRKKCDRTNEKLLPPALTVTE